MVSNAIGGNVATYRHYFNQDKQDLMGELHRVMREGSVFIGGLGKTVKYNYNVAAVFCKAVDLTKTTVDDPIHVWSEQVIKILHK